MKKVLGKQKKTKLLNKWHFVENKRDYTTCHKNVVYFLDANTLKMNF
jgi:hypothetical protein